MSLENFVSLLAKVRSTLILFFVNTLNSFLHKSGAATTTYVVIKFESYEFEACSKGNPNLYF